jgi:hypothetical protein
MTLIIIVKSANSCATIGTRQAAAMAGWLAGWLFFFSSVHQSLPTPAAQAVRAL